MITRITRFFYFKELERILKTIKLFKKKFEQKQL